MESEGVEDRSVATGSCGEEKELMVRRARVGFARRSLVAADCVMVRRAILGEESVRERPALYGQQFKGETLYQTDPYLSEAEEGGEGDAGLARSDRVFLAKLLSCARTHRRISVAGVVIGSHCGSFLGEC